MVTWQQLHPFRLVRQSISCLTFKMKSNMEHQMKYLLNSMVQHFVASMISFFTNSGKQRIKYRKWDFAMLLYRVLLFLYRDMIWRIPELQLNVKFLDVAALMSKETVCCLKLTGDVFYMSVCSISHWTTSLYYSMILSQADRNSLINEQHEK